MKCLFARGSARAALAVISLSVLACSSEVAPETLPSNAPADNAPGASALGAEAATPPDTSLHGTHAEAEEALVESSRAQDTVASGADDEPPVGEPAAQDPADTAAAPPASGAVSAVTPTKILVPYRGVNLSGAEFGGTVPGRFGVDYTFPNNAEIDYYVGKGVNTFRVPFRWERVQPRAKGALDAAYLAKLDAVVAYITWTKGAKVVLNPQNFARYYGNVVGSSQVPNAVFADFWQRLAWHYKNNSRVLFNLMNEPHDLPTEQWVSAANAAIAGIRQTGSSNTLIVPGSAWTGAFSWYHTYYGTPNAVAMLKIKDPQDRVLFEVHQYLDADSSGKSDQCVSSTIGSERLASFVKWLRLNGKKGFVGELAGGRNSTCYAAVFNMLKYVTAQSDVLVGWLWWGAGPWWKSTYPFALDAIAGQDRPQMSVLAPFLK
jgi:endoglucanase